MKRLLLLLMCISMIGCTRPMASAVQEAYPNNSIWKSTKGHYYIIKTCDDNYLFVIGGTLGPKYIPMIRIQHR